MSRVIRYFTIILAIFILVGCAYGKAMRKGDAAFEAQDWDVALTHYEAALAADPNSAEAQEKVRLTKEQMVGESAEAARAALAAGDLLGAMDAAKMAYNRLPDGAATREVVTEVSNATFAKAQELAAEEDYANALMLYESLGATLPTEEEKAQPHAAEVRDKWSAKLEAHAKEAEAAERKGDALLAWAKLAQLSGEPAHARKRDRLREEILDEWTYWVHLTGQKNAGYEYVVSGLVGSGKGTAMRIVQKLPREASVDAKVKLSVSPPKFRTTKKTRNEVVQYQSGTRQVENPFYKSKQDKVLDEERRLVDYQEDVDRYESEVARDEERVAKEGDTPGVSTGAEQSLSRSRSSLESARRKVQDQRRAVQRAKEELAREPATKEEPVYSDHQFTITTHTLTGESKVSVKITHEDARKRIEASQPVSTSASDDAYPAQPIAGVAEDPLQLPSKSKLTDELYAKALVLSKRLVDESFSSWRERLFEKAVTASTDDARVNLYVIYIVTNPRNVKPSVPADLSAMRGIPDAVKVLSPAIPAQ